jgi:hypothetical protein
MPLNLKTASGGSVIITGANTASDKTITVPARDGNVAVDGPAFSAYNSGYQTITNATWTKINADTENFDTNSNFASSRFTPTVAGYYGFGANIVTSASATGLVGCSIYKNGSKAFSGSFTPNSNQAPSPLLTAMLYANGSTDYFELYFYQNSGSNMTAGLGDAASGFFGFLARAA